MSKKKGTDIIEAKEKSYSLDSILISKRFTFVEKDLIKTLFDKNKKYTILEIENGIKKAKERKVKK